MDLLAKLNPDQQLAVTHKSGPALVLAGAGSGKTTVLTTRAMWLIEVEGVSSDSIILVTFTNKAALEMRQRIQATNITPPEIISTFHSFSARILRIYGEYIGLKRNFIIYDTDDSLSVLKTVIKELKLDRKRFKPQAVKSLISNAKNELIEPDTFLQMATNYYQEEVAKIYTLYQKKLQAAQAVDFDDLLNLTLKLLKTHQATREKLQARFQHVLVDEYQDTNKAQYELTKLLTAPQNNLFVVGDFAQSIYAWRGADYRNMLKLKSDFPQIAEYRLEQNYRSTQTILDAATCVIRQNQTHPILTLWTEKTNEAEKITLIEAADDRDEAWQVVDQIKLHQAQGVSLDEMAILYRTNAQSRAFEEALIQASIPYQIIGGIKFYERKEIKDLIAYLRLMLNPKDEASFVRAEKVGKRRLNRLLAWQKDHPEFAESHPPTEVLEKVLKLTEYTKKYKPEVPEDLSRLENIQELKRVALNFENLVEMLENIALIQDGYMHQVSSFKKEEKVQLMSLHSAKGLEFRVVFLVGMEDGLLPHSMSQFEPDKLEEERRLCYVGITRAKEKLYLSFAKSRYLYGRQTRSLPSRFIFEINPELFERPLADKSKEKTRHYAPVDEVEVDKLLDGEVDVDEFLSF